MTNKKKVVVVGNCQARPIATLLEAMSDEIEVTKVAIVHLLNSDHEAEYKPFFEEADYIIAQLVASNYPCEFVRSDYLSNQYGKKVIKIVNLFFKGMHADWINLKDNKGGNLIGPLDIYHNEVILNCWHQSIPKSLVVSILLNSDFYEDFYGAAFYTSVISLKGREEFADVKITDYIESKDDLFWIFNHPKLVLLKEYVKRIIESYFGTVKNFNESFEPLGVIKIGSTHQLESNKETDSINKLVCSNGDKKYNLNELIDIFYSFYHKANELTGIGSFRTIDIKAFIASYYNKLSGSSPDNYMKKIDIVTALGFYKTASQLALQFIEQFGKQNIIKDKITRNRLLLEDSINQSIEDAELLDTGESNFQLNFNNVNSSEFIQKKYKNDGVSKIDLSEINTTHYIFNENSRPRKCRDIIKIENGYLSIDFSKNYQYDYYFFTSEKKYLEELSFGESPFLLKNNIINQQGSTAFLEDRFTKFNICHLLFDKLPRLFEFKGLDIDRHILFNENTYTKQVTEIAGIKLVELGKTNGNKVTIKFDCLYISSSSSYSFQHPGQLCNLNFHRFIDLIDARVDKSEEHSKRFFIDRSMGSARNITNQDEFYSLLKSFNVEIIKLEQLSFIEQVSLFKNAELVIGVHGAGLANAVFCKDDSLVIEILPALCATNAFWFSSLSREVNYHSYIAQDPDGISPNYLNWKHNPKEFNRKNVIIDCESFSRFLLELEV